MTVWGVDDRWSWLGAAKRPLLFDADARQKPALAAVRAALSALTGILRQRQISLLSLSEAWEQPPRPRPRPPGAQPPPPRRRRRPPQLQVVGPVVHQPRDAPGDDQLGHADHRAARPRARAAHQPAPARLGDPRLHDRLDRARARRPAACPTCSAARTPTSRGFVAFALASLGAGFAADGTQLILWRDPPGHRRARSCSPTPPRSSPTRSPSASSAWPWARTRWSPPSGLVLGPVLGGVAGLDLLAVGVLVQRPVRPRRARSGAGSSCTSWPSPTSSAASTCSARPRSWSA